MHALMAPGILKSREDVVAGARNTEKGRPGLLIGETGLSIYEMGVVLAEQSCGYGSSLQTPSE